MHPSDTFCQKIIEREMVEQSVNYLHPNLPVSHNKQIEKRHHSIWVVIKIEK